MHASDVCVLNAAPLLDVRPSPPMRPTCRDPCGSLFLHPHFVMLQRCLSAFTLCRAPLPIKTTVSHIFFTLFSFFFFLRFCVLCAPFECLRPQMRPSHATTPGCPEAEAAMPRRFDECRCLHSLSGEPIRSFLSSVEKLTSPFCVFVPAPTRPTCQDPCGSPSLTSSCRRHPPPAQSRNDANRITLHHCQDEPSPHTYR